MPWRGKNVTVVVTAGGDGFLETTQKVSEPRVVLVVRLLLVYFARKWEFGSTLSKLTNFGAGGLNPQHPRYPTGHKCSAMDIPHLKHYLSTCQCVQTGSYYFI